MTTIKSRFLLVVLSLSLMVGLLPMGAVYAYASDNISVNVTVINKGGIENSKHNSALMNTPMEIPAGTSAIDAVKAAHNQFHADGANSYTEASGFFTKFWGEETYNVGYFNNGVSVSNPAGTIMQDGDYLDLMLYEDWKTDQYANFTKRSLSSEGGAPVEVQLAMSDAFGTVKESSGIAIYYSNDGSIPSIDTGVVTDAEGKANLTFFNEGAYSLMAKKDGLIVNSSIADVEITSTADTAGIVAAAKQALTFDVIKGENAAEDQITSNLSLPVCSENAASYTWSSSNTSVIANDGTVTLPAKDSGNANVTLTATITAGSVSDTKKFSLTVLENSKSDAEVLAGIIAALPTTYDFSEFTEDNSNYQDTNAIDIVSGLVRTQSISASVADEVLLSDGFSAIATDGTITYVRDSEVAASGNVTIAVTFGIASQNYTFAATVPVHTRDKADAYAVEWMTDEWMLDVSNSGFSPNTSLGEIKHAFKLPATDPKGDWTKITWSASTGSPDYDPVDCVEISSYTTNEAYTVKVKRPQLGQPDVTVVLAASIEGGVYWDYGMGPVGPKPQWSGWKNFTITIPAVTQEEQDAAQALVNEASDLFTLDNVTVRGTEDKADLNNLTYHINGIPLNWNYVDGLEGFKEEYRAIQTQWSTTNPGFKDDKISATADVIRANEIQSGNITLTLSYNGASTTKSWPTTIAAWTNAEAETENTIISKIADELDFDIIKLDNSNSANVSSKLNLIEGATLNNENEVVFGSNSIYHKLGANIAWESSNEEVVKEDWSGFLVTQPAKDTEVTLTATLTSPRFSGMEGVEAPKKEITFTVLGTESPESPITMSMVEDVAASIKVYVDNEDENYAWMLADLASYEGLTGPAQLNKEDKTGYARKLINDFKGIKDPKSGDLAKYTIVLSSLGYNASNIKLHDGSVINMPTKLIENFNSGIGTDAYTLPYVLLALQQDSSYASADEINSIKNHLVTNSSTWMDTTWGTDAITPAILSLSPYYNEEAVKTVLDAAVEAIKPIQKENGALYTNNIEFGAPSTGLAIAALTSIGIDPQSIKHSESGKTIPDGLVSYYNDDTNLFNPTHTSFSTEQGFRGLISAVKFEKDPSSSYRLYDFSGIEKTNYEEAQDVTVTFNTNGGSAIDPIEVEPGHTISKPQNPKKAGFIFSGWYSDSGLKTEFKFNTAITKDTTLYTKWTKDVNEFSDVSQGDWFAEPVEYMVVNGFMTGYSNTDFFAPYDTTTRSMMITVLWRVNGKPSVENPDAVLKNFPDVGLVEDWSKEAWAWAASEGVTTGQKHPGDGKYYLDPQVEVKREQIATLLHRDAGSPKATDLTNYNKLKDKGTESGFATEAMKWIAQEKIITGNEGYILPHDKAMRCELTKMVTVYDKL